MVRVAQGLQNISHRPYAGCSGASAGVRSEEGTKTRGLPAADGQTKSRRDAARRFLIYCLGLNKSSMLFPALAGIVRAWPWTCGARLGGQNGSAAATGPSATS